MKISELVAHVAAGGTLPKTNSNSTDNLFTYIEEFVNGISHDRNMLRMVQEHRSVDFKTQGDDFFSKHGLSH
jgi:hypothetical protein